MTETFNTVYTRNAVIFNLPWHKNKYPSPDDIVIGHIDKIEDNGLVVSILDYMKIEALMPLQELSRRKISSIRSLFKEGDIKPLLVLRVDTEKGYIDLSNKYINMAKDEIVRFDRYALLIKIFFQWINYLSNKQSSTEFNIKIDPDYWIKLLSKSLWLYSQSEIYDIFINIKSGDQNIRDIFPDVEVTDEELNKLKKIIDDTIIYNIELQVNVSLVSWGINSIETIKTILSEIRDTIGNDCQLIKTTAPNYVFSLKSKNKQYIIDISESLKDTLKTKMSLYHDIKFNISTNTIES